MNETIKLKLLSGIPFTLNNGIQIKPLTLKEIVNIGYLEYNMFLSNLIFDLEDVNIPNLDKNKHSYWDIIISNMYYGDKNFQTTIITALNIFLNTDISFCRDTYNFKTNNMIVDKKTFDEIRDVLKLQNCIEKKIKAKTANSKAEEIRQKILKGRLQLDKKNNNIISFEDLVSVLAANGNGLNILNIWDLTMYQFNNQFSRMQMIEDYNINIRQLLAGAKKEDMVLKHYIRPIENNKETL